MVRGGDGALVGHECLDMNCEEIHISREWESLTDILGDEKGIVLLIGATNTGKSTLAKYLISRLCQRGINAALVDADIGQSFLGPPTTIGLSIFDTPPDWDKLDSPKIFFVGSTTPEGNFPLHLKGTKKMVDRALCQGAEVVLVDTTGFVFGEYGKELKKRKIELLRPCFLIALQRAEEIEHILTLYRTILPRIFRLQPSAEAGSRIWEERKSYRMRKFQEYFNYSEKHEIRIDEIRFEGEWSTLSIKGLLLGLKNSDDNTLALGILNHFSEEKRLITLLTPLKETGNVRTIQTGSLRLTSSFEDERF
jgi:polynucleotide 5'-hydroxyl-kinase GRC3/NOL9